MAKDLRIKRSIFAVRRYIFFFLITDFAVTSCFMVFLTIMQDTIGVWFTREIISRAAIITFVNIFVVSAVLTVFDGLYSKFTVQKPFRKILSFTDELATGKFGIQLRENSALFANEFDIIIVNLNRLSRELSSIEALRSDFIASVSHEIKTPIAIIQNYIQLILMDDSLTEEKRTEYLNSAMQSAKRLNGLVGDILRLTKLEKQEIFCGRSRFSLSDELADCVLAFENRMEEKNLILEADIEEDVFITSDRELLDIVWNNLLSNAVKFTDCGGKIGVSLHSGSGKYTVCITDSGCGISSGEISKIFDKFYQGNSSRKSEGNGLGLALVRRIIDISGGEISVSSVPGRGSEFKVVLS